MSSRTIKFFTLGCKANQYDTQSIRERFLSKGFREIVNRKQPDYLLINTCTVTSGADRKSRNIIRRCIQANPAASIIVTGCLAENDWVSLADIKGIGLIIKKSFFPEGISRFSGRTRAFLKIQDGCNNFCSYCKVALVRGRERSKKLTEIIKEAKALVAHGYKEIVLTGICLGAYGKGLPHKKDLVDVIDALEKIEGLSRIRLSSIEAGDVSLKLIRHMRKSKKLCRHLHIPIQSGDDAILKRMNRKYTSQKYLELISKIKSAIPGIAITTDVLVGFPGESEENFQNTVDLVQKIQPLKVHIFPYSPREGTAAAKTGDGSIALPVIPAQAGISLPHRISRLKAVAEKCSLAYKKRFLNKSLEVLLEARDKQNPLLWEGLTDNYLKVKLPLIQGVKGADLDLGPAPVEINRSDPGFKNKIVLVRLKRIIGDSFMGEMSLDLLCL